MFNLTSLRSGNTYPPGSEIPFPTKYPQSFTTDSQVDIEFSSSNTDCATVSSTGTYPNQVLTITTYQNGNSVITGIFTGWVKNDILPPDQPNIVATPDQAGVPEGYTNVQVTVKWTINVTGYFDAGGTTPIQPEPDENGVLEVEELQRTQNLPEDGYFPVIDKHNNAKKVRLTQLVDAQLYNSLNVLYSQYRAQGITINDSLNSILSECNSLISRLNTQNVKQQNAQERIEQMSKSYDVWDGSTASASLTGTGVQDNPFIINSCADWIRLISDLATYSAANLYVKVQQNLDFDNHTINPVVLSNSLTSTVSIDFTQKEIKNFVGSCLLSFNVPVATVTIANLILNSCQFSSTAQDLAPIQFASESIINVSYIEVKNSTITHTGDNDGLTSGVLTIRSTNTPTGVHQISNCSVVDSVISSNKSRVAPIMNAIVVSEMRLQNCYSKVEQILNGSTTDKFFAGIAVIQVAEETARNSFFANNISSSIQYGENCKFSYGTVALVGVTQWSPSWYGNYYQVSKSTASYYSGNAIDRVSLSRNQIVINTSIEGDATYTLTDLKAMDTTEDLGYSLLMFDFGANTHNDIIKIGETQQTFSHTGANLFDITYYQGSYQVLQTTSEEISDALMSLLSNFNKKQEISVWDGFTYTEPSVGSGTVESPYQVSSAAILAYFLAKRTTSAYIQLTVDVSLDNKPLDFAALSNRQLFIDCNSHRLLNVVDSTGSFLGNQILLQTDIQLSNVYLQLDKSVNTVFNLNTVVVKNSTIVLISEGSDLTLFKIKGNSILQNVKLVLRGNSNSFRGLLSEQSYIITVNGLTVDLSYTVNTDFYLIDNFLGSNNLEGIKVSGQLIRSHAGNVAISRADDNEIKFSDLAIDLQTQSQDASQGRVCSFSMGNTGQVVLDGCKNLSLMDCSVSDQVSEFAYNYGQGVGLKNCQSFARVTTSSEDSYRVGATDEVFDRNSLSLFAKSSTLPVPMSTPYSNDGIKNYGAEFDYQSFTLINTTTQINEISGVMFITVAYQSTRIVVPFTSRPMLNEFIMYMKSTFASVAFSFSIEGVQQTIYDSSQTTTPPTTGFNAFLKYRFWRIPGRDNTWCYTQLGS